MKSLLLALALLCALPAAAQDVVTCGELYPTDEDELRRIACQLQCTVHEWGHPYYENCLTPWPLQPLVYLYVDIFPTYTLRKS